MPTPALGTMMTPGKRRKRALMEEEGINVNGVSCYLSPLIVLFLFAHYHKGKE